MTNRRAFRHLLALLLIGWQLLAANAFAAGKVLDVSQLGNGPISLPHYLAVLEDPTQALTWADIRTPEIAARFKTEPAPAAALSYGFTRSAYWLRLTLSNPSDRPAERMLEIGYALLSTVDFYQPARNDTYQHVATGNARPFATRPYKNRFFVFPLTVPANSDQVYYLRVQSINPMIIAGQLWAPSAFHAYERNDYVGQALYFGMVMAMVLFNLLLFIAIRNSIYLRYVVFVGIYALTVACGYGLAQEFLWPQAAWWSDTSPAVGSALAFAAFLVFTRQMLATRTVLPRMDPWLKVLIGVYLLSVIPMAFWYPHFALPLALLVAFSDLLILGVGLFCVFKRQRIAFFFTAACSMMLIGSGLFALLALGVLPSNLLTVYGLQIGSALEMFLLAFALADRFNEIRREKERAQQSLVRHLERSERLVEERTVELHEKNKELERLSVTDRLTGLFNRRRLDQVLDDALLRCQRYNSCFALVLMDLDHFKSVNDTLGHPVGDMLLVEVARLLGQGTREVDVVGRWGGEEFLIICPNTPFEGAMATAENLRELLAEHTFAVVGKKTASFGVVAVRDDDTILTLMARCDAALYRSKSNGRNRVEGDA